MRGGEDKKRGRKKMRKREKKDKRRRKRERKEKRGNYGRKKEKGRKEGKKWKRKGEEKREKKERRKGKEKKGEKKRKGGYYGYRVTVKGTLNGGRRTRTYERQKGTVPGGTKRARVRMGEEVAKTTVGTRGVRVEYCYGRG